MDRANYTEEKNSMKGKDCVSACCRYHDSGPRNTSATCKWREHCIGKNLPLACWFKSGKPTKTLNETN